MTDPTPATAAAGRPLPVVTVGICTFRRPAMLERLLDRLIAAPDAGGSLRAAEIVLVDNDAGQSALPVVQRIRARANGLPLRYVVEPEQNIALARNRVAAEASGHWLAIVDDDEFPAPGWLERLVTMAVDCNADGVLGPVLPHFPVPPPSWITKGRFFEKPRYAIPNGALLHWTQTRTSNALLAMELFRSGGLRFDPAFGRSGGEDMDFFRRAIDGGARFVWCADSAVYEEIGPERCRLSYLLRLGWLRGSFSRRYGGATRSGRLRAAIKSAVACGTYTALMPLFVLRGRHVAADYLQRWCEHAARLLASVGIEPTQERPEFTHAGAGGTSDVRR